MNSPVHNYPLSKLDLGVLGALSLSFSSMPFPVVRLMNGLMLGAATAGIMIGWLALVVVAQLYIHVAVTAVLFLGGALALVFLWFPWVRRKTFLDRCAHTLVISRLITHGDTGSQNLVTDARQYAQGILGTGDELDETLNATSARARMLMRRLDNLNNALPFEVPGLMAIVRALTRMMMPFISSLVIAYVLVRADKNVRRSADDALCYVAQNGKQLIGLCARAVASEKLLSGTVLALIFACLGGVMWMISDSLAPDLLSSVAPERRDTAITIANVVAVGVVALPISLIAGWVLREALIRPGLSAFVTGRFLQLIQQQPIDPTWRSRVDNLEEFARSGRVRIPVG